MTAQLVVSELIHDIHMLGICVGDDYAQRCFDLCDNQNEGDFDFYPWLVIRSLKNHYDWGETAKREHAPSKGPISFFEVTPRTQEYIYFKNCQRLCCCFEAYSLVEMLLLNNRENFAKMNCPSVYGQSSKILSI
jgi:hypothetical protein